METCISSYGYKIKKKFLNLKQIEKIRKDLMITPFIYDPVNNKQNTDKKFNWPMHRCLQDRNQINKTNHLGIPNIQTLLKTITSSGKKKEKE